VVENGMSDILVFKTDALALMDQLDNNNPVATSFFVSVFGPVTGSKKVLVRSMFWLLISRGLTEKLICVN
jgi:hypothetical protein